MPVRMTECSPSQLIIFAPRRHVSNGRDNSLLGSMYMTGTGIRPRAIVRIVRSTLIVLRDLISKANSNQKWAL